MCIFCPMRRTLTTRSSVLKGDEGLFRWSKILLFVKCKKSYKKHYFERHHPLYNLLYKYTLPSLMLKHPLELKCLLDCCYFNCVNRARTKKEYPPCSKPTSIAANLLRLLLCGPFELLPSNGFQRSAARPLNGPQTDRCHHQLDKKKERERERNVISASLSLSLPTFCAVATASRTAFKMSMLD